MCAIQHSRIVFKSSLHFIPDPRGRSGEISHLSQKKENNLSVPRQRWNLNETTEKAIFTHTLKGFRISGSPRHRAHGVYTGSKHGHAGFTDAIERQTGNESWVRWAGLTPTLRSPGIKIIKWAHVAGQGTRRGWLRAFCVPWGTTNSCQITLRRTILYRAYSAIYF